MTPPRWTDERLDDRFQSIDRTFERIDRDIRDLRREMREGFAELRTLIFRGGAAIVTTVVASTLLQNL